MTRVEFSVSVVVQCTLLCADLNHDSSPVQNDYHEITVLNKKMLERQKEERWVEGMQKAKWMYATSSTHRARIFFPVGIAIGLYKIML